MRFPVRDQYRGFFAWHGWQWARACRDLEIGAYGDKTMIQVQIGQRIEVRFIFRVLGPLDPVGEPTFWKKNIQDGSDPDQPGSRGLGQGQPRCTYYIAGDIRFLSRR